MSIYGVKGYTELGLTQSMESRGTGDAFFEQNSLRYPDPEDRIFNRDISVISLSTTEINRDNTI